MSEKLCFMGWFFLCYQGSPRGVIQLSLVHESAIAEKKFIPSGVSLPLPDWTRSETRLGSSLRLGIKDTR